ncbi:glycosyltransferase [Pedococcus sp. 2YAF34]|uniref:glycosyltransferase n=1 Tax=Pedococcus sp. 2YAF34 TaxID=3233032 RepID=UPI003F95863D
MKREHVAVTTPAAVSNAAVSGAAVAGAAGSSPAVSDPAAAVRAALEDVRSAPSILRGLRAVEVLTLAAARDVEATSLEVLRAAVHEAGDGVVALGAIHALAALPQPDAETLVPLLHSGTASTTEHTAWALADAPPLDRAIEPLVELVAAGGFTGMLAQRTLERWAPSVPDRVLEVLVGTVERARVGSSRADLAATTRLVETIGLVPGHAATAVLVGMVQPAQLPAPAALAAAAALGDRFIAPRLAPRRHVTGSGGGPGAGRTVAQLFLHADIDGRLTSAGKGDTGGIATLLVQLGDALLEDDRGVDRVITISRGGPDSAPVPTDLAAPGHHYAPVPLWGPPVGMADAWVHRVAVRRGVRRILQAAGRVDAIHLRMADVGSLAAAEAAAELGVPVVFTLAPDPHVVLARREAAGTLTRATFAEADAVEHLAYRDRLVRDLAERAEQLVLFPRPDLARDTRELLGVDLDRSRERARSTVVAEGIDFRAVDRAGAALRQAATAAGSSRRAPAELDELDALLATLPEERRGLPLAISVGRLNRVKGMATLVRAWSTTPELHDACNLLVVGGDLVAPSPEEAAELGQVFDAVPRDRAATHGLLLSGHRPHDTVATWLAATLRGRPGLSAPGGVYVSASLKEEFGLAILEAMAASLVVVAPDGGGPATYVEPGVTGILTDTSSAQALASAVVEALALARSPQTLMAQRRALASLRDRFSIDTMADALACVYAGASSRTGAAHTVCEGDDHRGCAVATESASSLANGAAS